MTENLYQTLLTKVQEGIKCVLLTYLEFHNDNNGSIAKKVLLTQEDIGNKSLLIDTDIYEGISNSLDTGKLHLIRKENSEALLIEPFIPRPRLIVFGGGHIAKPLSEFAAKVGFSVTVIDDRPFFANKDRFPEAEQVICESFQHSFELINFRSSDFAVIITRGHKHDDVVLREVLNYELSYIGMIGSKRRVSCMLEELENEGFDRSKLSLVNAPIGLDINAITPNEIAISIASQLISFKNKAIIDKFGKSFAFPELDDEVLQKASEKSTIPKALITILSTKGSVPRKSGAKMIATYDGRTFGSIGGGCSEAGVINSAKSLMLEKGFQIELVDMTGDVAEAEGMVCGGLMEVLVEVF